MPHVWKRDLNCVVHGFPDVEPNVHLQLDAVHAAVQLYRFLA